MKITVTCPNNDKTVQFDVCEDLALSAFQALVATEFEIPVEQQQFMVAGRVLNLTPTATLKTAQLNDQDVLVVIVSPSMDHSAAFSQGVLPEGITPAELQYACQALRHSARDRPQILNTLDHTNPEVAQALRQPDDMMLRQALTAQATKSREATERYTRTLSALLHDPLNPEAQALLLNAIQQQQIDEALDHAQEHLPESFTLVPMLYVPVEVNGTAVKALVDTGAQKTIMSLRCAEKCGLTRLIDRRFQGVFTGVGTSAIIGRIHMVQIKMGNTFFAASLFVLEHDQMDFVFGLDLLKRYQCTVDLGRQVLQIEKEALQFLTEAETRDDDLKQAQITTSAHVATPSVTALGPDQEKKVKELMELGFSRATAAQALIQTEWNIRSAAALLFHDGQ